MRIIGIDPGYDRCGIAIIEKTNGTESLLYSTCIETNKNDSFPVRLGQVVDAVVQCIHTYTPETLSMETLIFNKNQKTALRVSEVRGALLYIAYTKKLTVFEYSPQQIKVAIAGSGAGTKHDVTRMVRLLLHLPPSKKKDDEYDAIATALVHSAIHR